MKAQLLITVNLDPVPGWGNKVEDFVDHFRHNSNIPHYIESVEVVECELVAPGVIDSNGPCEHNGGTRCSMCVTA